MQPFVLSKQQRGALTNLDQRLSEEVAAIEDAIAMHLGMMPRQTFNQLLAQGEIKDWQGQTMTEAGGKHLYAEVARAADELLGALDRLIPLRKKELGDIMASYDDHRDFPPCLTSYAVLKVRLASEAQNMVPNQGRGNPRKYQRLVLSLAMAARRCGASIDWARPAQPSGRPCGLVALCLEAAGETVRDMGLVAEIVRRALKYQEQDNNEAWSHARRWELHRTQKCDPETCEFCA